MPDSPQNVVDLSGSAHPEVPPRLRVQIVQDIETNTELVRYGFKDVDHMMSISYIYPTTNLSTICDIVAMYLKGQKILYTEAKTLCEMRLHFLMLPAVMITSACAILSLVLKNDSNGTTVTAVMNGVNVFILTLINYLKLDARAEAHRTTAYKFDKLQSYVEFNSGRLLFDEKASTRLVDILQKVENDVREIKETNQFILPEKIRYMYPKLYNTNVFAEVKKIQNTETLHVDALKDHMNRIMELEHPFNVRGEKPDVGTQTIIDTLEIKRKEEIREIIQIKDKYLQIDERFEKELAAHRDSITRYCDLCSCLKL